MPEIPIYLIVVPVLTITVSLISTVRFEKYFFGPVFLFVVLNFPTIAMPMMNRTGWESIFGWAVFYTFISFVISYTVWKVRKIRASIGGNEWP
ncbi:hypothetical protein EWH99_02195 [Sporolactobacillus sp. THM7-7]|nr:hypothetical protein EWH99_02195 [Sporolactobacillus sp. THM7-7]